jgi:hypothetical protein
MTGLPAPQSSRFVARRPGHPRAQAAVVAWVLAAGLCCAAEATHLFAADAVPGGGGGALMVAGPQAARAFDPITGQEVILVPPGWQRQEPFAALPRLPRRSCLERRHAR